jgi:hypothetical protein
VEAVDALDHAEKAPTAGHGPRYTRAVHLVFRLAEDLVHFAVALLLAGLAA